MTEPLSDLWEASLLGLLRVRCGEQSVDHFQTRQTALLFAYLVTYPRRHTREELIDLLWPEAEPESGRRRLSQAIWHIRQTFQEHSPESAREVIAADRNTVSINSSYVVSDIAQFRQFLQRAELSDKTSRIELLEQAVAIYGDTGGFLVGFYDDWVLSERQKLLTDYLTALKALTEHYEKIGEWQRALKFAEQSVSADLLREESHQILIRLLLTKGQLAAARRQYDNLSRLLARELNTEPSAESRALILSEPHSKESGRAVSLPVPLLQVVPLPVLLTTFYGRESLRRNLVAMLAEPATRLITLLGSSGMGKTRLALELAQEIKTRSSEPLVAFVPLADIVEPRLILESIADALTPRSENAPVQRIVDALTTASSTSPFLLVLDNAEHLAEQVAVTAAELLARIHKLQILVTSQRSLGISGEREVTITPLELPLDISPTTEPENASSVQLFLDRAKSVRPGFPTDAASLADVARICERLEGLPLAIELCAGWAQTLGTQQMMEMLARRFELLVSRRTDIPARHRTLRAAIEYSYMQLSQSMQELFVQLSVFRDGWTLAAAAAVCTENSVPMALAILAQMRERSLIVSDEIRARDGMRYKMLESLRDFASEQQTLVQSQQHNAAHAAYFSRFVEETVARMQGTEESLWAARLEDEIANIRAALEYLLSRSGIENIEMAWKVTAQVTKAWNRRGHAREALQWVTRSLAMPGSGNPASLRSLRAQLFFNQAESLRILSDYTAASESAEKALAIWREVSDTKGMTECLELMGITALFSDDYERAQTLFSQALALARERDEPHHIAQVLNGLGGVAVAQQDWKKAHGLITETLEVARRLDQNPLICSYLNNLSLVARYQGHYSQSRECLREAILLRDRHGLTNFSAFDLNLAVVERLDGCYAESLRLLEIAIRNTVAYGERRVLAWCVKEMGHLAVVLEKYGLGLRLLSCAEAMRESIGMSFKPMGPQDIARDRSLCEEKIGATEATAIWALGASSDPEILLVQARAELEPLVEV